MREAISTLSGKFPTQRALPDCLGFLGGPRGTVEDEREVVVAFGIEDTVSKVEGLIGIPETAVIGGEG